jgi:O-antigen ligase
MPTPQFMPLTIYQNATLLKFTELLSYAVIFLVLINTVQRKSQFKRIIWVIIFTALAVAILEIANNFGFPFVNRNHFAGNMELAVPLVIGYILSGLEKPQKIIFAFIAVILTVSLFLSLSRAGTLCFLGSIIFMISAFRLRRSLRGKVTLIYALIIISFILLLVMGIDPFLERFGVIFKEDIFGRESRLHIWRDTLKIIRDFPVLGTGLGTFRNIYPMYKTLAVQARVFYAHSDFLQLISEVGFIGLGLAAWFLITFFKEVYFAWISRHNPFAKGIVLGGLTGALAILLHSFFDFSLQIPANALFFTVTSAMVYKCIFIKFKEDEPVQVP